MRIVADGKEYVIDQELSLGEHRMLKRLGAPPMDELDPRDPDVLVGLIVVAAKRQDPARDTAEIVAEVEKVTSLEFHPDEDESEADPTSEGSRESSSEGPQPDVGGASADVSH